MFVPIAFCLNFKIEILGLKTLGAFEHFKNFGCLRIILHVRSCFVLVISVFRFSFYYFWFLVF